jgi:hypothetical protein
LPNYFIVLSDFELIAVSNSLYRRGKLIPEFVRPRESGSCPNLCHPCIAAPISFVAEPSGELKIVRLYTESRALAEVIAAGPAWWRPIVKCFPTTPRLT